MRWRWNSTILSNRSATSRQPRVTGEAGRDALAVAEQILAQIERAA